VSSWPRHLELLRFSPQDNWTLDEASLGTLIFGATGSGKTTGPFQYVLRSFLRHGFGGIFLCAKKQSFDDCMMIVRAESREKDVVVFELPESENNPPPLCFNFLTYEAQRYGEGKVIIENVVRLLTQVSEVSRSSGNDDKFFENAMTQLLRHALEVIITARGKVDLGLVLELVQSLPQGPNDLDDPEKLFSLQLLMEAKEKGGPARANELYLAEKYFTIEWVALGDKTRSSISITLTVFLDLFLRFPLRNLFMGELTISPDHVLKGGILIVNLNIPEFELISKFAGVIWKHAIQRAIERRPELKTPPIESVRPIFIAVDEAQFWVNKSDFLFQTTARSNRGLTVYATQNIANFNAEMASDSAGRARVSSMVGNLQNRFFCQNLEPETNLWAADSIGRILVKRFSANVSYGRPLEGETEPTKNVSESVSEQLDYDVQPRIFTGLRRGADLKRTLNDSNINTTDPKKQGQVEAILVVAGRRFATTGERWLRVFFDQFHAPPLWLMWFNRQPWAYIMDPPPFQTTRMKIFLAAVPLTLRGLWEARQRVVAARKAEDL